MSKFNLRDILRTGTSAVVTDERPSGVTFEGAPGYARDTKGELFLLTVTSFVAEDTFYEAAAERDARLRELVTRVAADIEGGNRPIVDAALDRADEPGDFLATHRTAPSLRWGRALEQALQASLASVPSLRGRTLVLVDRSGSMFTRLSSGAAAAPSTPISPLHFRRQTG